MKKIKLTQGKYVLVDDEDFAVLNKYKWHFHDKGAAVRKIYISAVKQRIVYMHREIMKPMGNTEVDHINHDQLDNRKNNLRLCNRAENNANMRMSRHNSSSYKGVSYNKKEKKYRAYISIANKQKHLGYFPTAIIAAKAYNEAAKRLRGVFAWINPL